MKHLKTFENLENQRDENALSSIKQFIQKFDVEDDVEFEKKTREYISQFKNIDDKFITFMEGLKENLYKMENDIITREYIDKYVSIANRMINLIQK